MHTADSDQPALCVGQAALFDAAHEHFSSRWRAARLCAVCPRRPTCLDEGTKTRQPGVWGGMYSSTGANWRDVAPVTQKQVTKTMLREIRKAGLVEEGGITPITPQIVQGAIGRLEKVFPGLDGLLVGASGPVFELQGRWGSCLVAPEWPVTRPDGTVGSLREYVLAELLAVEMPQPLMIPVATCGAMGCVTPWHLRWSSGGVADPQEFFSALRHMHSGTWTARRASEATGILSETLRAGLALARSLRAFHLPDATEGAVRQLLGHIGMPSPLPHELTTALLLCHCMAQMGGGDLASALRVKIG